MTSYRVSRVALIALALLGAASAIGGGIALLIGTIRYPLDWLQGSPFSDYAVPAIILILVVGGSQFMAAAAIVRRKEWMPPVALTSGVVMMGWIVVEVAIVGSHGALMVGFQIAYFAIGLLEAAIGTTQLRARAHAMRPYVP